MVNIFVLAVPDLLVSAHNEHFERLAWYIYD